jgi:hypothetical protein
MWEEETSACKEKWFKEKWGKEKWTKKHRLSLPS